MVGVLGLATATAQDSTDTTNLVSGGTMGNVQAGADFTSGAFSVITGDVWVTGDITLGAGSKLLCSVHSSSGTITYSAGATVGSVK